MALTVKKKFSNVLRFVMMPSLALLVCALCYYASYRHCLAHAALRPANEPIAKPYIFVGGYGRSGTTLMRAILDVHEDVFCGVETGIVPHVLDAMSSYMSVRRDPNLYSDNSTIEMAVALFVQYMIEARDMPRKDDKANAKDKDKTTIKRPCAKDPYTLAHIAYLHRAFPRAQFVYMVRNARSACYSQMVQAFPRRDHNMTAYGLSAAKIREIVDQWNNYNTVMYRECVRVGERVCIMVKYEQLVAEPEETIQRVARFLGLSWTEAFLNHERYVGGKVQMSKSSWTRNVKKGINTESLNLWKGRVLYDEKYMANLKMQKTLGYS